ncbi:MAG: Ig-like domain-containing protein, partial [Nitrospirae bacterium]|nr:Ig-like domain-containing protein [Nitrospirota bacterium]
DPPTATNLSAAETYTEDTALNLIDIVASDVDSANNTVILTLSDPAAGSLTTGTSGAVTSTYNAGTGVWTATGAIADVNTLLAGVTFTPTLNFNSNFTIATSVSDGEAAAITGSKTMTGIAVNDAPTATNLSAAETYTEDTALDLIDIVASDVDSANITVTLTLSDTAAGSLNTGTSGAVTSTYNAGTGVWTASGALADVNVLLAGVIFTPALDYNSTFTIATSVSDGVTAITGSKTMTGTPVNDPPVNTVPGGVQVVNEDTALPLPGISVTDVDGDLNTVQLAVTNGTVTVTLFGTATISAGGNGTNSLTLSGSEADINTTLASLAYQGTLNYNGPETLTVTSTDSTAVTDVDTVAITVTAVNDAPVLGANNGSTVLQGLSGPITSGELQVTDVDNTPAQLIYTVTIAPIDGRLELTTAPGVAIMSFTQADINAGRLVFVHSGAVSTSDSFTFTVSDGAGGTIGATTFNFTVTPFSPPPVPVPVPIPIPVPVPVPVVGPPVPPPPGGGAVTPVLTPPVPMVVQGGDVSDGSTTVGATDDPVPRTAMSSRKFARVEQPDFSSRCRPGGTSIRCQCWVWVDEIVGNAISRRARNMNRRTGSSAVWIGC